MRGEWREEKEAEGCGWLEDIIVMGAAGMHAWLVVVSMVGGCGWYL